MFDPDNPKHGTHTCGCYSDRDGFHPCRTHIFSAAVQSGKNEMVERSMGEYIAIVYNNAIDESARDNAADEKECRCRAVDQGVWICPLHIAEFSKDTRVYPSAAYVCAAEAKAKELQIELDASVLARQAAEQRILELEETIKNGVKPLISELPEVRALSINLAKAEDRVEELKLALRGVLHMVASYASGGHRNDADWIAADRAHRILGMEMNT